MTNQTTPRTWAQQKDIERQLFESIRREWLDEIARSGMCQSEAARSLGVDRGLLIRMCRKFDVSIKSTRRSKEADRLDMERLAAEKADMERRRQSAKYQLEHRKSALMAEGYTEAQALRAVAHQMGVSI